MREDVKKMRRDFEERMDKMKDEVQKIQEEKAESFKKAQEEAFLRDLETFKEKADKNGEWMTRIRVSA